jgi:hypothetical protein
MALVWIMLELRLNITASKILHSYKNNGNTKSKAFNSNSALIKKHAKSVFALFAQMP